MDFNQFKKEWCEAMVYKPSEFDYENTMHELYVEYKHFNEGMPIRQWCEFFHAECDLDTHPYMLKHKALGTNHGNGLKQMANKWRESVGIKPIDLI